MAENDEMTSTHVVKAIGKRFYYTNAEDIIELCWTFYTANPVLLQQEGQRRGSG